MVKVEISPEAQEYIRQRADAITVQVETCYSWGGVYSEPAVYAGAPTDASRYNLVQVDGLSVYLHKDAGVAEQGLRIKLRSWGIFKRLIVEGLVA